MFEPATEAELADAIRDAKGTLKIRGGGTRPIGNPTTGEVLSSAKLSGISLYEPGALTIVAKAGTPLDEIEKVLAKENQRLPFEPMDHRTLMGTKGTPTIGGVVAANVSGPRRIQAGACRDSLIGVRFVDGQGTILKNGGRVMKNVTGYDLVKLMAGSYGTLGVLSEVSFKVLPATGSVATLTLKDQGVAQAVASMSAALGSPFEVSAAAHIPGETPLTHLRIEGFADSVKYRATQLSALLEGHGDISIQTDAKASHAIWGDIRDVATLQGTGNIWRISVKPSDAPVAAEALKTAALQLDWGGGLIWANAPEALDVRAALAGIDGHATLIRGTGHASFHPEPAPIAAIAAGLRAKFDPKNILNAGLMA